MAKLETETYLLPASWAAPLMYGDYSGLNDEEREAIDILADRLQGIGLYPDPIYVEDDAFFYHTHDAFSWYPYVDICATFIFAYR